MTASAQNDSEILSGAINSVVRTGDRVRRPSSGPAVHAYLNHLEERGFGGAPRFLGTDGEHEVLSFMAGTVFADTHLADMPDAALPGVAHLLAELHETGNDFVSRRTVAWTSERVTGGSRLTICHNDVAPRNTVLRDGRPVGLIDWDLAGPEIPDWDLAHAVWQFAPLDDDRGCRQRGFTTAPDRLERMRAMVLAYGPRTTDADAFAGLVALRIRTTLLGIEARAARGEAVFVRLAAAGVTDDLRRQLSWVRRHREVIAHAAR
ncbi:aminoglycoside phosphotransferase family protein [Micromonospora sp. NPDC051141]|uniref:aminoglycoside phosphotransferase family protein n=1 Tax=Micromonospora sp. NPDC051141 TaxID=3364284 RepID=UPI003788123B